MKSIQLLFICFFCCSFIYAQPCANNPAVQAGDINPAPLAPGVIGEASFTFMETLTDYDEWQSAPVKMTVCFLHITPTNGANSVSGKAANWFDWIYDEPSNCLVATQNQTLIASEGGHVKVAFEISNPVECNTQPNQMGFAVNVQPAPCMTQANEQIDDSESVYACYDPDGTPTSLDEISKLGIDVLLSPNPATEQINLGIESKTNTQANITIYDILGKAVKVEQPINIDQGVNSFDLNISELGAGTYFMSVLTEEGNRSSFKFVKTNNK